MPVVPLLTLVVLAVVAVLLIFVLRAVRPVAHIQDLELVVARAEALERVERALRDETARVRDGMGADSRALREEVLQSVGNMASLVQQQLAGVQATVDTRLLSIQEDNGRRLEQMRTTVSERLQAILEETVRLRDGMGTDSRALRAEVVQAITSVSALVQQQLTAIQEDNGRRFEQVRSGVSETLQRSLEETARLRDTIASDARATRAELAQTMAASSAQVQQQLESTRAVVDTRLKSIQDDNAQRLEQMRVTVDEKLQGTLEKRLGESFRLVSERLEKVHQGLGEMQALAEGVGDLKKVLTNVKTRGTWGEVQLGSLLEQILSAEQFEHNVAVTGGPERVEYAIRLPGRENSAATVWLPIDAKFPQEDYTRLVEASERADPDAVEYASRQLELRLKACARDICAKYIQPPQTTDFAILFLPTEGLYAEVLRRPGLAESVQRDFRVVFAGPTTLAALLNSLQMGFRTLAIQKRSSEVWEVLGSVKNEFGKYAGILEKVHKKLNEATNTVEEAAKRTRVIQRRLRNVESADEPLEFLEGFDDEELANPLTHSAGR